MILFRYILIGLITFSTVSLQAEDRVRRVKATSCEAVPLRLAVGMTTQIIFDTEPTTTLLADKNHFKIHSNEEAKRSIAIIPVITPGTIERVRSETTQKLNRQQLVERLDKIFNTNLFVFFDHQIQLMFKLRFVPKKDADYIVRVKHQFTKDCQI